MKRFAAILSIVFLIGCTSVTPVSQPAKPVAAPVPLLTLQARAATQPQPSGSMTVSGSGNHTAVIAWNNMSADGYRVAVGLRDGSTDGQWMAYGITTNSQMIINGLAGGMTWYFQVQSFNWDYQGSLANKPIVGSLSMGAAETSDATPCPENSPQGPIITNGVWVIAVNVPSPGGLQTSFDGLHFVDVRALHAGTTVVTGPVDGNQFFRSYYIP